MSIFGDIIGAGANLFGAKMQADASEDAAKIQMAAAQQAMAEQRRQFDVTRQDLSPWMTSGRNTLSRLDHLLGVGSQPGATLPKMSRAEFESKYDQPVGRGWSAQEKANIDQAYNAYLKQPAARAATGTVGGGYGELLKDFTLADFQADPGYQFRLSEGNKAIENSAAARGMQLSGANLKGLSRFNQDFASNEYGNAWNRDSSEKQRKFNFLSGQSGQGQQVATNLGQFGAANSGNISDQYLQAGNARAAGQVGSANAWGSAIGNITDYYRMRNLLKAPGSSGGSSGSSYSGAAPGFGQMSSMGW